MMTETEAKQKIRPVYDKWLREVWQPENPGKLLAEDEIGRHGFRFFNYLSTERSDLLQFNYRGDRWQIVKSWIMEYDRYHI